MSNEAERAALDEIVESYSPYHTIDAFYTGFVAYGQGDYDNPYDGCGRPDGVDAQAWDRGLEACMRFERWKRRQGNAA